jgi:hypothetical protein
MMPYSNYIVLETKLIIELSIECSQFAQRLLRLFFLFTLDLTKEITAKVSFTFLQEIVLLHLSMHL